MHRFLLIGSLFLAGTGWSEAAASSSPRDFRLNCGQPQSIRDFKDILMWGDLGDAEKTAACYCGRAAVEAGTNAPPVPVSDFNLIEPALSADARAAVDRCIGIAHAAGASNASAPSRPRSGPKRYSVKRVEALESNIAVALASLAGLPEDIGELGEFADRMAKLYENYPRQHGSLHTLGALIGRPCLGASPCGGLAMELKLREGGLKGLSACMKQSKQGDSYLVADACFSGALVGDVVMADREGLNEHIAALAAHWTDAVSRLSAVPVSTKTYLAGLPDDHLKAGDAPCSSAVVGCAQHMAKTIATIQNKLRSIPSRWTAAGAAVKNNSTAP